MTSGIGRKKEAKAARRKKVLAERRKFSRADTPSSQAEHMRQLAKKPLHGCLLQSALFETGCGMVILTRKTDAGRLALAAFLVDVYCLGVKDAVFRHETVSEIEDFIAAAGDSAPFEEVDPSYARKLLRDAAAYGRSLGFPPAKDYAALELLFGDSFVEACDVSFRFGHDGKPLYIPGPGETRAQIRRRLTHLRRRLGDDSFGFSAGDDARDADFDALPDVEWDPDYDPAEEPDPAEWLALDEQERLTLVLDFHRHAGIPLPDQDGHAMFHVVIENQVAQGDELPVRKTLSRLMTEGLDRHEALHAIGWVLMSQIYDAAHGKEPGRFPEQAYNAAVEQLTAESWRQQCRADEEADLLQERS